MVGSWLLRHFRLSDYPEQIKRSVRGALFRARFLRIYPGFLVALLMVAFVFAPLSAALGSGGSSTFGDSAGYVLRNILLPAQRADTGPSADCRIAGGALLYVYADRIRVLPAVAVSTVLLLSSILTGTATVVAPLPFALLVFVLGAVLPLQRIGAKVDLSFGIHLYGVPAPGEFRPRG